jgi:cell division protein FtsI/penicillin-binding protein 2
MPDSPLPRQAQCDRVSAWSTVLVSIVACLMLALLGRVAQLKIRPDERLADASSTARASRLELARRGDLLDRRGRIVATSTVTHRLFVDAAVAEDPGTLAVDLGRVIDVDPIDIDRKLHERPESRYVVIADVLDEWQVEAVRTARLRGVGLEPRLLRDHPHRELATALIGKVGFEHEGRSGLEFVFDRQLREDHGTLTELRDVRRKTLWIEGADYEPGRDGGDVQLSLDMVIQQSVETRLRRAVLDHNAGGGRSVVVDCTTGEILAMCDVLNPRPGWDEHIADPLRATDPALARNRCVTDAYEPGSTFKPFIWATATALGHARLDEVLDTPTGVGHRTSYGRLIRDSHYYGPSTWVKVLVKSMNSGMAIVGERMTFEEMQRAVRRFGFGATTGCGLRGSSRRRRSGATTPSHPSPWATRSASPRCRWCAPSAPSPATGRCRPCASPRPAPPTRTTASCRTSSTAPWR